MTVLIKCVEREISVLGIFESQDLARHAMEIDLAKELGLETVPENWAEVQMDKYDSFEIHIDRASMNIDRQDFVNYDWKIVTI